MIEIICKYCGEKFNDYESNNRKYCCRRCYEKDKSKIAKIIYVCPICKEGFVGKRGKNRTYCSNKCKMESFIGKPKSKQSILKGIKTRIKNGNAYSTPTYIDKNGFVVITKTSKHLHTAIAEKVLGRLLKPNEVVHHIDEDRSNNKNSNLVICERSLHPTIHARIRKRAKGE